MSPLETLWDVLDWCVCQQVLLSQNGQLQVALLEERDTGRLRTALHEANGGHMCYSICEFGPLTPLRSPCV